MVVRTRNSWAALAMGLGAVAIVIMPQDWLLAAMGLPGWVASLRVLALVLVATLVVPPRPIGLAQGLAVLVVVLCAYGVVGLSTGSEPMQTAAIVALLTGATLVAVGGVALNRGGLT